MLIVNAKFIDPAYNLALEEYLVTGFEQDVFRLWQNSDCIIVGRNQNTLEEINAGYVAEHRIPVIRRMSGGGAVFHDLGNVNFTFVKNAEEGDFNDYRRFTKPIIDALDGLGIKAELSGRNDIVIEGKKISGNAQYKYKNRILHHGTLLLSSSASAISSALTVDRDKIESKGIKSVRSRVTNINSHLAAPISVDELISAVTSKVKENNAMAVEYELTEADKKAVEKLVETKYSTYEWNFGYSPNYMYHFKKRFEFGSIEAYIDVREGLISALRLMGDYFGENEIASLESELVGVRHERRALETKLAEVNLRRYIAGASPADLLSVLI